MSPIRKCLCNVEMMVDPFLIGAAYAYLPLWVSIPFSILAGLSWFGAVHLLVKASKEKEPGIKVYRTERPAHLAGTSMEGCPGLVLLVLTEVDGTLEGYCAECGQKLFEGEYDSEAKHPIIPRESR